MLIACHSCARQYDVGNLASGKRIRCTCGELNEVPEPQVRETPMQQCASCGGELSEGELQCKYCSAKVTITERGWGDSCPSCYARMIMDAKFCSACGIAIQPQVTRKSDTSQRCPRCKDDMAVCELPGGHFTECTGCGGVWLEEGSFEGLTTKQEHESAVGSYFSTPERMTAATKTPKLQEVRYLSCPQCGGLMNRKNFAKCSGIIIDWCKGHGYWFDAHELEQILEFVSTGGLEKSRQREIESQNVELRLAQERARKAQRIAARESHRTMGFPAHRRANQGILPTLFGSILGGFFD